MRTLENIGSKGLFMTFCNRSTEHRYVDLLPLLVFVCLVSLWKEPTGLPSLFTRVDEQDPLLRNRW